MPEKYIISFRLQSGQNRVYDPETDEITTMDILPQSIGRFIMLNVDDNEASDEDLREYAKNFKEWCFQMKTSNLAIDYANCYSDYTAVTRIFNRFCLKFYKDHEEITPTEFKWQEKCSNCGMQYIKTDIKNTTLNCFSYDYKNQYGLALNSEYKISSKQGKEVILNQLPEYDKIEYGYYHVKIQSNDENFKKVFMFSKENVYHSYSLLQAMEYIDVYEMNINIELVCDGNPNAYIYEKKSLVSLKSITTAWFNNLTKLRKQFKKNRLIKHLISSAWGHLNAKNVLYLSWEQIQERKLSIGITDNYEYKIIKYYDYGDREYYELLDTKKPYKHNIRLKPIITAISRIMTANISLKHIDEVVRVHTDSITFTTEHKDIESDKIVMEEKTTGLINWHHVNSYYNTTTGYKTKNFVEDDEDD